MKIDLTKDVVLFILIFIGLTSLIYYSGSAHPDELWLLAGVLAGVLGPWIGGVRKDERLRHTVIILLLVLGAYLMVIKAPKALSIVMSYQVSAALCFAMYAVCLWILLRLRKNKTHS